MAKVGKAVNESNRSLSRYLEEIGKFEPLHPDKEVELAQKIKKNDNYEFITVLGKGILYNKNKTSNKITPSSCQRQEASVLPSGLPRSLPASVPSAFYPGFHVVEPDVIGSPTIGLSKDHNSGRHTCIGLEYA